MSNLHNIPKGSFIFREGETAKYAYVIQEGTVEVIKLTADGESILSEIKEKNTIFGEMALIDGEPRSAGVRAKTDVTLSQVDKNQFLDYVAKNPKAAHNIMIKLSRELRLANGTIADLRLHSTDAAISHSDTLTAENEQSNDEINDTDAIYDTKPSQPLIYAGSFLTALLFIGSFYASIFEIDTTVSSRGKFATKVPNVEIQSTSSAIVKEVMVERGDTIKKDQLIAILDETNARTNLTQNTETLRAVEARLARIKFEQDFIKSGSAIPANIPLSPLLRDILRKRVEQYRSKQASFASRINKLQQEIRAAKQEIASASESVKITYKQADLKRQIEHARKVLYDQKNGSFLTYLQSQDATLTAERAFFDAKNLFAQKQAAFAAKNADLAILQADREEFTASWSSRLGEDRSKEEQTWIQLTQEGVKLKRDMSNVEVRAPVDGVILELPSVTSGSIVREGEVITTMVRTNQPLTLEVDILPKDVSDVRVGSEVSVKLDALPFQQYGDIKGALIYLSDDTYDKGLDGSSGAFYRGRVEVPPTELKRLPSDFRLTSGMTAAADMKVGKRRLITYLTYPIIKGFTEAFREPD